MTGKRWEVSLFRAGEVTIVLIQPVRLAARGALVGCRGHLPGESVAGSHKSPEQRGSTFVATPYEVTPGMWAKRSRQTDLRKKGVTL